MTPPASTEPVHCDELMYRCKHLCVDKKSCGISGHCKYKLIGDYENAEPDSCDIKKYQTDTRARGTVQQAPAPTNHLAIPCPKCGKWIFRANVDEGYTLFCSDDECGWKQKIVAQQEPTSFNIDAFEEKLCEYLGVNFPDWNMAKHERHCEDIGSLAEDCLISLAEHDTALIAQEREKWERETPIYPCPVVRCTSKYRLGGSDSDGPFVCGECGDTPLDNVMICPAIAAQAREDVLKEAIEKIWSFQRNHIGMNPLIYRGLDYAREEVESLRSEVGK